MNRFLFIVIFVSPIYGYSQCSEELIVNGGFEELYECPPNGSGNYWDLEQYLVGWKSASWQTPDVFNICAPFVAQSLGGANVPQNYWGYQWPHSGNGYAGLGIVCGTNFCEYLGTQLASPIEAGKPYIIDFYLSSADTTHVQETGVYCVLRGLEFLFSEEEIFWPDITTMEGYTPQYSTGSIWLNDSIGWMHICDTLVLDQDAQWITIGRWTSAEIGEDCDCFSGSFISAWTYYYIDDLSIRELNNTIQLPSIFSPNGDGKNDDFSIPSNCGQLKIYNRWGGLVASIPRGKFWDGSNNSGEPMPEGVYYFIGAESTDEIKGTVQLVR